MLALVGRRGVDLGELELEQVELALARAGELAQLLQPLAAGAALSRVRLGARAQAQRLLGAAQLVEQLAAASAAIVSLRCSCWP